MQRGSDDAGSAARAVKPEAAKNDGEPHDFADSWVHAGRVAAESLEGLTAP
jgi:hypothetical protein